MGRYKRCVVSANSVKILTKCENYVSKIRVKVVSRTYSNFVTMLKRKMNLDSRHLNEI